MKPLLVQEGFGYRLRPVRVDDASFIVDVRLQDLERNKFISPISADVELQKNWIRSQEAKADDFYFVIENRLTGESEGLIGLYDMAAGRAEWGRWVLKKGSLGAVESVDLLFKIAFGSLKLQELYCRTIADNTDVVSFHDSLPEMRRGTLEKAIELRGETFDAIEHYVTPSYYREKLQAELENRSHLIFQRNFRFLFGKMEFHHIGVATTDLETEFSAYRLLGYKKAGEIFEDPAQGIRGLFIEAPGQPRLELLQNLEGSQTLDIWLERKVKMYHFAYRVVDIEKIVKAFNKNRIRTISPLKVSAYFGKRICFLALSNLYMIELIES